MLMVDRSASPYAGLRSASVRESSDKRNNQRLKLHAKPSKHPFPPPRSGFVQPGSLSITYHRATYYWGAKIQR
jgi:hypothetical protein